MGETGDPILGALADLALTAFDHQQRQFAPSSPDELLAVLGDPLDRELAAFTWIGNPNTIPGFSHTAALILSAPALDSVRPRPGQVDPMVLHQGWGIRLSGSGLVMSLLTSALEQIFFLGQPRDAESYVRLVLQNFEELCKAARGEPVRAIELVGFGGVRIPPDCSIRTPWGSVTQLPYVRGLKLWSARRRTTVTLAIPIELKVRFDSSPHPVFLPPDESLHEASLRAGRMFPLAVALATTAAAAAAELWANVLPPFAGRGTGYLHYVGTSGPHDVELTAADIEEIEKWLQLVDERHAPTIDIAVRRLLSALAYRTDPADKLVDSVMAWENLFGTRTESSFRVTAALARFLEPDRTKRRELYKTLADLYGVRSRVVHGDVVGDQVVETAADKSLYYATNALKKIYLEHPDWLTLTSTQRSDRQLLEEP